MLNSANQLLVVLLLWQDCHDAPDSMWHEGMRESNTNLWTNVHLFTFDRSNVTIHARARLRPAGTRNLPILVTKTAPARRVWC